MSAFPGICFQSWTAMGEGTYAAGHAYVGLPLRSVKLNEVEGSEGRRGTIEYCCEITRVDRRRIDDHLFMYSSDDEERHLVGSRPQAPDPRYLHLTGKDGERRGKADQILR